MDVAASAVYPNTDRSSYSSRATTTGMPIGWAGPARGVSGRDEVGATTTDWPIVAGRSDSYGCGIAGRGDFPRGHPARPFPNGSESRSGQRPWALRVVVAGGAGSAGAQLESAVSAGRRAAWPALARAAGPERSYIAESFRPDPE